MVPDAIRDAGSDSIRRFVEFFTANIRNVNTRLAYLRATRQFCAWLKPCRVSRDELAIAWLAQATRVLAEQLQNVMKSVRKAVFRGRVFARAGGGGKR